MILTWESIFEMSAPGVGLLASGSRRLVLVLGVWSWASGPGRLVLDGEILGSGDT